MVTVVDGLTFLADGDGILGIRMSLSPFFVSIVLVRVHLHRVFWWQVAHGISTAQRQFTVGS